MKKRFRSGGLAAWSIQHPIAVTTLAFALVLPGLISLQQLRVDLLPDIIYPNVRVRVLEDGVPALIMEDQVTRQLEEQLAITEGAISVQSVTREGRSAVDLAFPYGTDIDIALRDASARLDRAKRLFPDTIEPPVIYKTDPSQAPVLELVVSSVQQDQVSLYQWIDYEFAKSLINLPGVAAVEVGGGMAREIAIDVDQDKLAAAGLTVHELASLLETENQDASGGRLLMPLRELNTRVQGRFTTIAQIKRMPLMHDDKPTGLTLSDIASIYESQGTEQMRIRLDGIPGIKVSIQKQPQANTVEVVDAVLERLDWMKNHDQIPPDIKIKQVNDQSVFIRHSLRNAATAAATGAVLAMTVVYLFLGNLRRTLIVGATIPLAILVTFMLMQLAGLSLNIMTFGGLALGIGILVDNTIVMLENIYRHQRQGESRDSEAIHAAAEVNSPIVASTTTNLAAVLPFLFVGGLVGLIFRELIFTISAAITASMIVALTLIPALAAQVHSSKPGRFRQFIDAYLGVLQSAYAHAIRFILRRSWLPIAILLPALVWAINFFIQSENTFLPKVDEGQVRVKILGDTGMQLETMDAVAREVESLLLQQSEVKTVFSLVGGFVYGRTQWLSGNRSTLSVQLVPRDQRLLSTQEWVEQIQEKIDLLKLAGFRIKASARGRVRGIRLGHGEDDLNLRISGPDLEMLAQLADKVIERIRDVPGLRNAEHTYENTSEELTLSIHRTRAADLEISIADVTRALKVALDGLVVTDFIDDDRKHDIRLNLPHHDFASPNDIGNVIVALKNNHSIRIRELAEVRVTPTPASITRDRQVRTVEISARTGETSLETIIDEVYSRLAGLELPPGYRLYDDGAIKALQQGQRLGNYLLAIAIFLVFVVMAVQYESLQNPFVILISIPFAAIGVAGGLWVNALPLSMPVWLGMIMLAGIVVNNAIVLVEQIEIQREGGHRLDKAIVQAARARLRPILMTTLTTVAGMMPLALGLGEGAEMLQPLAVVIVWGLSFSMLVSLILVPVLYRQMQIPTKERA